MPESKDRGADMTISEAANELAVSQAMIYRMVKDGKLKKTVEGSLGPEGEPARVSLESVQTMKRRLITRLEKRLEKLRAGGVQ